MTEHSAVADPGALVRLAVAWVVASGLWLFVLMAWDKRAARRARRRVRERTLVWTALLGGAFGGVAAAAVVRHKTRHRGIMAWFLVAALAWGGLVVLLAARGA